MRQVWEGDGSGLATAEASSSCRLSRKVSLLRVTRKPGPKNRAPRRRRKDSSGMMSRAAAPLLVLTACKARHAAFEDLVACQSLTSLGFRADIQGINVCFRDL